MSLWFEELKKKKDACYRKVRSRYDVWPSAYASGAVVQCRKVGAKNWGNSKKKKKKKVKKAESKYSPENLSEGKRELLESEPSFDVDFPEYDHPDNKEELAQVLSIRENNPIDKDEIEDLDKNNNEMMMNIVGESKKDRKQLIKDIDIHTIKLKVKYGRPRPYEITDKIDSITDTDDSPSFPSGHAIEAHALAKILAEEYPDKKEELEKMAEKISLSRVQMGSHFPSDIEVGKKVGLLIADAYLEKDVKKSWQDILVKDWVSCSSCTDDKEGTEPCGRKDASKGTKRRCRPTCSACKDYKRRAGKKGKRKKRKAGTFSKEKDKGLHGWFERGG
tara:strand:+ start:142 stop:1140 length:999 start_codon:yes stop_codon:yes gene_type:complete